MGPMAAGPIGAMGMVPGIALMGPGSCGLAAVGVTTADPEGFGLELTKE